MGVVVNARSVIAVLLVERATEIVRTQFQNQTLTLASLATHLHVSSSHLSRLLARHTGRGFAEQLRDARISHAVALLTTTMRSVKEIAADVGYLHVNELCRNFKRVHHTTPSQYRSASLTRNRDDSHRMMTDGAGKITGESL